MMSFQHYLHESNLCLMQTLVKCKLINFKKPEALPLQKGIAIYSIYPSFFLAFLTLVLLKSPISTDLTSSRAILRSKLVDRRYRVQFLVALVNQMFGVFHSFLRNSIIYYLGSLKKTPMERISPAGPDPISRQLALIL